MNYNFIGMIFSITLVLFLVASLFTSLALKSCIKENEAIKKLTNETCEGWNDIGKCTCLKSQNNCMNIPHNRNVSIKECYPSYVNGWFEGGC